MATIYRAICHDCDQEGTLFGGSHLAIITGFAGEATTPNRSPLQEDQIVILQHPGEESQLEALGWSASAATRDGRMILYQNVICSGCGTIYDVPELLDYSPALSLVGCLGFLLGLVGCAWLASSFMGSAWIGALVAVLAAFLFTKYQDQSRRRSIRARFPERFQKYDGAGNCPRCGESKSVDLYPCPSNLPCPQCGGHAMRIEIAGRS